MIGIDKAKAYLKGFGEKLGICNQVNLLIIRDMMTKDSTLGKLYLDGEYICETLELPWVDNKKSISCIPKGSYKVRFRYAEESASYNYTHLLVKDVLNRSYILFHIGNRTKDSRGCILTGKTRGKNFVGLSRKAHKIMMDSLIKKEKTDNINLIIKNR
jgi:hypothetical protein|tara:strand:+ start:1205 stop:1678 length:474 start_codon:yes stop_codon:yes gene_type:complete